VFGRELPRTGFCAAVACFFTEQREWPCHDCCKVLEIRRKVKKEDITFRKKARCHVYSEKLKEKWQRFESFQAHDGGQAPQALAFLQILS
jgi:hypothetical protein